MKTQSFIDWRTLSPLIEQDTQQQTQATLEAVHDWFRGHPSSPALGANDVVRWLADNAERINGFYRGR